MDKDFVYATFAWAAVVAVLIIGSLTGLIIAGQNDHNFDKACLESGNTIRYTTIEGSDDAHKECR